MELIGSVGGWVADWLGDCTDYSVMLFFIKRYHRNQNGYEVETLQVDAVWWGRMMSTAFIPKISGCFHGWTWITFSREFVTSA